MRLNTLMKMLQFKRPMGSRTEANFRKYFLHSIPDIWEDDARNLHVLIPRKDHKWPKVMWSSHTDTVHVKEGFQKISLAKGFIGLAPGEKSNCLGADCTVGVWIMREMVTAKIPGHYVFHWGEERGCIGSSKIVKEHPEYFRRAKAIVAFDRRNGDEVITFQRGIRMASDAFAESLCAMLPREYAPSKNGIYTDSAEYNRIVPECTNVGVGYAHEHSSDEELDLKIPVMLLNSLLKYFDEDNLIIERDPRGPIESKYSTKECKYLKSEYFDPGLAGLKDKEKKNKTKPVYQVWENGQLVQYASEEQRMQAWLQRKEEQDEFIKRRKEEENMALQLMH